MKIFYFSGITFGIGGALYGVAVGKYLSALAMLFFVGFVFLHYKYFLGKSKQSLLYISVLFQILWLITMYIEKYANR